MSATKKIKAIIVKQENGKFGNDQLNTPIMAPKIPAIMPMTAPNTPATSPNSPPKIPIQIGNVKINSTISKVELERDICLWFILPILFQKPFQIKKRAFITKNRPIEFLEGIFRSELNIITVQFYKL
jgi:hypothetical protein